MANLVNCAIFTKLYSPIAKISLISIHACNSGWIRQTFFHQTDLLVDSPNFSPTSFVIYGMFLFSCKLVCSYMSCIHGIFDVVSMWMVNCYLYACVCLHVADCPIIQVPGRVYPVTVHHLEDLLPEMRCVSFIHNSVFVYVCLSFFVSYTHTQNTHTHTTMLC